MNWKRLRTSMGVAALLCGLSVTSFAQEAVKVFSPNQNVQFTLLTKASSLQYMLFFHHNPVIENSAMELTLDGVNIAAGVAVHAVERYEINETYPWRGLHALAVNHCRGAKISLEHEDSGRAFTLEIRAYNDGAAFRWIIPGEGERVISSEATAFQLPKGSTVWYHDFHMHYEGNHTERKVSHVPFGDWAAPPLTFKLPSNQGYASITEAALLNYSGMGLQADGHRRFVLRLGHEQPPNYPYVLRYGAENAERLSHPAPLKGTITTPWRGIMVGGNLNTLVNSDLLHNLSPPPSEALFPNGFNAEWLEPGRAVWGYLNRAGRSLDEMKELSRLAGELGFEYHVVEGHWSNWSLAQQKELVQFSKKHGVKIVLWKHTGSIRDPEARRDFFQHCQAIGAAGVKLDFFDHEAKEVVDFYQTCLREAAQHNLVVNFHGANKPTGLSRTWPNELVREAIKGLESRGPWAKHNTTLPFTRMLAGPADYTAMHFGGRRTDTTQAHQIASAMVLAGPMLVYAEHPQTILNHPAVEVIKQIPAVWDETIALPVSEIGKVAAFAKRSGDTWFLSVMNGPNAKQIQIDLDFLGDGDYQAAFVRDKKSGSAAAALVNDRKIFGSSPGVTVDRAEVDNGSSLYLELLPGGGFAAMMKK